MRLLAAVVALGVLGCSTRPPAPDGNPFGELDVVETPDATAMDAHHPLPSPYPHYDFSVELPYGAPEQTANFDVVATSGRVDMHLLVDQTASFDGEISQLQRTLTNSILPQLRARIASLSVGVSGFEDMPFAPFGLESDHPFELMVAETSDSVRVAAAVARLNMPLGNGGDRNEAWGEALYQVATGDGLRLGSRELIAPFVTQRVQDTGTLGGVGFRDRSSRVVVLITDAPPHDGADYASIVPSAHTLTEARDALRALRIRVVGMVALPDARASIESFAIATGAVADPVGGMCATGLSGAARPPVDGVCPLVYDVAGDGSGLSQTVVDGLYRLLDAAVFEEVHGESADDPREFVTAIESLSAVTPDGSAAPMRADRLPTGALDGIADTFLNVHANARLTFTLHLRNLMVQDQEFPQVFFVPVTVVGDGTVLREITVRVIVPEGPKRDAGLGG